MTTPAPPSPTSPDPADRCSITGVAVGCVIDDSSLPYPLGDVEPDGRYAIWWPMPFRIPIVRELSRNPITRGWLESVGG